MTETNHLDAVLAQLMQERAELDAVIAALQKRTGKPGTVPHVATGQPILNPASGVTPTSVVYRGAFFNLSVTKAAEKLLKTFGRPLKTPEFVAAFHEAGFEKVQGEHSRSIVYTALLRSRDFVKVLPDTWDLAERHPEAAEKKAQELSEKAKAKNRTKNKAAIKAKPKAELKPVETTPTEGLKVA